MQNTKSPGVHIAELRKTYSISRETLAERSGLDIELIRGIEEEGLIPDLAPLVRISRALGVRLGTLLDEQEALGPLVTRKGEAEQSPRFVTGQRSNLEPPTSGSQPPSLSAPKEKKRLVAFHALAEGKSGRHMEPFLVDIERDAEQEKSSHEGEEFLYVMAGSITVEYGKDTISLDTGDSVYYDSIVPHRVRAGKTSASVAGKSDVSTPRILAVLYTPF
jgi:quercetin dioxygenase-like cupin family protein